MSVNRFCSLVSKHILIEIYILILYKSKASFRDYCYNDQGNQGLIKKNNRQVASSLDSYNHLLLGGLQVILLLLLLHDVVWAERDLELLGLWVNLSIHVQIKSSSAPRVAANLLFSDQLVSWMSPFICLKLSANKSVESILSQNHLWQLGTQNYISHPI